MIGAVQALAALGHCPLDNETMRPLELQVESLGGLDREARHVLRECAKYQRRAMTQYAEDAEEDGSPMAACYRYEVARAKRVLAVLDGRRPRRRPPPPSGTPRTPSRLRRRRPGLVGAAVRICDK